MKFVVFRYISENTLFMFIVAIKQYTNKQVAIGYPPR
jgi:hypothetical protein